MKKIFALLLAVSMVFALCCCGNQKPVVNEKTAQIVEEKETEQIKEAKWLNPGETVVTDDYEITIYPGYPYLEGYYKDKDYVLYDFYMTYKNKTKTAISSSKKIVEAYLDYNNGFIYKLDCNNAYGTIEPLETKEEIDYYTQSIPKEVAENVDAPLILHIITTIDGEEYLLDMRDQNR